MTLKEIYISHGILSKLSKARFKDPKKSYSLFNYIKKINSELLFLSTEIDKLKEKYLNNDSKDSECEKQFIDEANKLLQIKIEKPPDLKITLDDILEAEFPDDKSSWLTASDYGVLTDIIKD